MDIQETLYRKSVENACEWLADPNTLILDTATTSLNGFLVEIAVINVAGDVLLHTLVNPQASIDPRAAAIHGHTAGSQALADAPVFAQIAGQRLWPLRWKFVLESAARTIYHLVWFELGAIAMTTLALRTPYVGTLLRWEMIDLLHRLGVTQEAQAVISLMVVAMFMGRQTWGIVDVFWPGRGK